MFLPPNLPQNTINLTPLVDVVFLLLIFFIATTQFLNPTLELDLPQANNTERTDIDSLLLVIPNEQTISFQETVYTLDEFRKVFSEQKSDKENVILQIEQSVPFSFFITILDIVKNNGFKNISIEHSTTP